MMKDNFFKELLILILISILIGIAFMYPAGGLNTFIYVSISIFILSLSSLLIKKLVAYRFETGITTKLWSIYQFGFMKRRHFKKPVSMLLLPIVTSLFTRGIFVWLPLTEFDVVAKPERVSRRHGLYRYTEVTEWHISWIAIWGILTMLFVSILGYIFGFEQFAKLGIAYALMSLLPISSLDGSKILFGTKHIWLALFITTLLIFFWSLTIIV